MESKREQVRAAAQARATAAAQARVAAEAEARTRAVAPERLPAVAEQHASQVMACLRELGFRAGEARRAVEFSATIPDVTLEERVRAALKFLGSRPHFPGRVGTSTGART